VEYSALQVLKKLSKRINSSVILIFLGFSLLSFGGVNYYRVRILSFTKTPSQATQIGQNYKLPEEILIPSIGIDLSIETGAIEDGVWQISYNHPTFLNSSARPGSGGNIVIYGHNKKAIFGSIPYLSVGQKVYIKTTDDKVYIYEVYGKEFVSPDRVDLVSPTDHEELTIYTCWGLFDSQRVVIKAKPVVAS
jgi:LPXTG-site transpeptidase (sortase) family protein